MLIIGIVEEENLIAAIICIIIIINPSALLLYITISYELTYYWTFAIILLLLSLFISMTFPLNATKKFWTKFKSIAFHLFVNFNLLCYDFYFYSNFLLFRFHFLLLSHFHLISFRFYLKSAYNFLCRFVSHFESFKLLFIYWLTNNNTYVYNVIYYRRYVWYV